MDCRLGHSRFQMQEEVDYYSRPNAERALAKVTAVSVHDDVFSYDLQYHREGHWRKVLAVPERELLEMQTTTAAATETAATAPTTPATKAPSATTAPATSTTAPATTATIRLGHSRFQEKQEVNYNRLTGDWVLAKVFAVSLCDGVFSYELRYDGNNGKTSEPGMRVAPYVTEALLIEMETRFTTRLFRGQQVKMQTTPTTTTTATATATPPTTTMTSKVKTPPPRPPTTTTATAATAATTTPTTATPTTTTPTTTPTTTTPTTPTTPTTTTPTRPPMAAVKLEAPKGDVRLLGHKDNNKLDNNNNNKNNSNKNNNTNNNTINKPDNKRASQAASCESGPSKVQERTSQAASCEWQTTTSSNNNNTNNSENNNNQNNNITGSCDARA
ncbi:unnamed protein product [Polarella glacialis]|uniref:Uncharacterized protein n=1 Tax=Polarella glacialis TaxID=89957 RepID=A0A813KLE3_POLGL|nr:unnamed protein product [Polarella glacialis]